MKKGPFLDWIKKNLDCSAQNIQLTVKSGLEAKEIYKCRAIATHFHHSTVAQDELKNIQKNLQKAILKVINDSPTR